MAEWMGQSGWSRVELSVSGADCYLSFIAGLSSFVNVIQLDVSYNCLSDLNCVKNMVALKQLQTLQLTGGWVHT